MKTKTFLMLFITIVSIVQLHAKKLKLNMIKEKLSQFPLKLRSSKDNILIITDYLTESGCRNMEIKKALFIINSKYINVFDNFSPKVLINSVSFKDLVKSKLPFSLKNNGGKYFLVINKKGAKPFSIGYNDKEKISQLLKVIQGFLDYQKGNPIIDEESVKPCKLGEDIGKVEDGSEYLLNYNK
jgi:hypothetical protein